MQELVTVSGGQGNPCTRRPAGLALALFLLATLEVSSARAEDTDGAAQSLVKQRLNPLANSVRLTATLSAGLGPDGDTQPNLNFEPVIPFGLTDDWRVVSRPNVSIFRLPAAQGGSTGLGDTQLPFFLTPVKTGDWVWGAGPIVQIPTATSTALGTGKWSAGPTGALIYVGGPWVNGVVASQLWSVAGPKSRAPVSLTQLEVQVSYTIGDNYYVDTAPRFSYDWKAPAGQGWTVPIGFDAGKVFAIGKQELSLGFGAYYNVKTPPGSADWILDVEMMWLF
jgi:hypothetical protein